MFHYFYSTRFAPYRDPMPDREWLQPAPSHIETLLAALPAGAGLVTILDGAPATLSWLGGVHSAWALTTV